MASSVRGVQVRKLQKFGGSVAATLPRDWLQSLKLDKGSPVALEPRSDSLLIRPFRKEQAEVRRITIPYPQENVQHVVNQLTGSYLLGYDVIEISSKEIFSPEDREMIVKSAKKLVSLEVLEEDARRVNLQILIDPTSLNPSQALRRMHVIAKGMQYDAAVALAEGNRKLSKLVVERDEELDRLYFLIVRLLRTAAANPVISSRYEISPIDVMDYRVAAHLLENVGDSALEAAVNAPAGGRSLEASVRESLLQAANLLQENQELAVRAFLSKDTRFATEVVKGYEKIRTSLAPLAQAAAALRGSSGRHLAEAHSALVRTGRLHVDIADLAVPLYPVVR